MNNFVDDRGYSIFDVFPLNKGQINYSEIDQLELKAFHRHKHQTDYWVCVRGKILVNLVDDKGNITRGIMSGIKPELLKIPPKTWHGCKALSDDAALLYYVDKKYNPNKPDEERRDWDTYGEDIWEVEKK